MRNASLFTSLHELACLAGQLRSAENGCGWSQLYVEDVLQCFQNPYTVLYTLCVYIYMHIIFPIFACLYKYTMVSGVFRMNGGRAYSECLV